MVYKMTDVVKFQALEALVAAEIPGFEIRYKNESIFMKFIGFCLFFNPAFMTRYVTTIYPIVYFPTRERVQRDPGSAFEVLAHEFVHLYDAKGRNLLFSFKYLFPQSLFPLTLLAGLVFVDLQFLWFLGFLIFLLPIPALWRTQYEMRGYGMNMATRYWRYGNLATSYYVSYFTSAAYYYMMPFAGYVSNKLKEKADKIVTGRIQNDRPYGLVYNLLKGFE